MLRGHKSCKNLSFFALISKCKERKAKVVCGDSKEALEKKNAFGAINERHKALNLIMLDKIEKIITSCQPPYNFTVLCGDSHLFDKGISSSLPNLISRKFVGTKIHIFIQGGQ